MILIADSGSSKTDWRLINSGGQIKPFSTKGLNPQFHTPETIYDEVSLAFKGNLACDKVSQVYFYGAGCSSESKVKIVVEALSRLFNHARIEVDHDLLGAARAACGNHAGLAGILGTGSNCCVFDGEAISKSYTSGGFILGDEGGGVSLGKSLLQAYVRGFLPNELKEKFDFRYKTSIDEILESLYKKAYPNRYLASYSPFIFHNREHPFIAKLILTELEAYFDQQVLRYEESKNYTLSLVGSIAFYYQEFVREVAQKKGVRIGNILEKPIAGLTLFHEPKSQ